MGRPLKDRTCNYHGCGEVAERRGVFSYLRNGQWVTGRTAYYCETHYTVMCENIAKESNTSVRFTRIAA